MPKKINEKYGDGLNVKLTPTILAGMKETAKLQGRNVSDIARELFAKYLKGWLIKRY